MELYITHDNIEALRQHISDVFGTQITKNQTYTLIALFPDYKGAFGVDERYEFVNLLTNHFLGLDAPRIDGSDEYEYTFEQRLQKHKQGFIDFINE